jgi:hypothetical protein
MFFIIGIISFVLFYLFLGWLNIGWYCWLIDDYDPSFGEWLLMCFLWPFSILLNFAFLFNKSNISSFLLDPFRKIWK